MSTSITRTDHAAITAMTAVHDRAFTRRLGGVRFVERGSIEEVQHLAAGMSEKCSASRVPVGGQKTLIVCPEGVPSSPDARAAILAEHIQQVVLDDDGGIFGPDMACGADVLDLLANEATIASHITGLSESNSGLDINRQRFTARGVVHALHSFARLRTTRLESASVQGFGMVGAPVARALDERGIRVRAVSNCHGALVSAKGLDVRCLFELWLRSGDDCITAYARDGDSNATLITDPDALLDVSADIFVPAARTTVLGLSEELAECRSENRDVRSVEEFLERSGCVLVLEAANHPLTLGAEEYLERRGVVVLPDVLVNSGGMVGCYAEWRYRALVRSGAISLRDLADRCHAYTARVVEENVRTLVTTDASARCAASSIVLRNRAALLSEPTTRDDLFGIDH